jgi:MoxR-like ATPase
MNSQAYKLISEVGKAVFGKEEKVKLVVAALLSEGHVLIEDPPGLGKTVLAKALAKATSLKFSRIQLTPDVLPLDITGSFIFRSKKEEFEFVPGPIFANIVLADELNRTTPRTQSALLEAMEEKQVTVDGQTFRMPEPFFVIATQNPYEHHGTFPLPESQLDRFALSLSLEYPDNEVEKRIVNENLKRAPLDSVEQVLNREEFMKAVQSVREVSVSDDIVSYIVSIVRKTREIDSIVLGASPRASIVLGSIAKALAFIEGRDFVIPDDVKKCAPFVLRHRILVRGAISNLKEAEGIIRNLAEAVEVPVKL